MPRFAPLTLAMLGALGLGGCATFESSRFEDDAGAGNRQAVSAGRPAPATGLFVASAPADSVAENVTTIATPSARTVPVRPGIAYFLPRQLAKVTAVRTETNLKTALDELGAAELALAAAKEEQAASAAAIKQTEDAIIARGHIPAVLTLLNERLAGQKDAARKADDDVVTKTAKREGKRAAVTALRSQPLASCRGNVQVSLKIELLAPSADPAHGFVLDPKHSIFRDDEHKVTISAGLLSNTDVVATDRTADILVDLATFAGAIKGFSLQSREPASAREDERCTTPPEVVTAIVDFADAASVAALNQSLSPMGARLVPIGSVFNPKFAGKPDGKPGIVLAGVAYRTPAELVVRIEKCLDPDHKCSTENWFATDAVALSLPQAGPISYVREDAGFMTKTTYSLAFKDGMLTSYAGNRPSELLQIAATPMRVLNGVFDGASQIISLRTSQNKARAGLTDGEKSLLQSQTALVGARNAAASQLSAGDLTLMLDQLRDKARRDAINKCVDDKTSRNEPIDPCLVSP